ncbi:MAG: hypothetical protein H6739_09060 [Alphaproteobacteria bacterium]|nr:hypothetical protein [Alphaproteobacteria bacterium]
MSSRSLPALRAIGFDETISVPRAAVLRRAYLHHEAAVIGMGWLWVIAGALGLGGALGLTGLHSLRDLPVNAAFLVLLAGVSVGKMVVGVMLTDLDPRAHRPALVVAALSLPLPHGLLPAATMLYLGLCLKGRMVLSPLYQKIRRESEAVTTPLSPVPWALACLSLPILVGWTLMALG